MSKYEELRAQIEAAEGDQLSRLGRWTFLAYRAGEITGPQMYELDDVWRRRATEVKSIRLVSAYEALSGTIRSAHDEATLRAPGSAVWRAFELGQITEDERHQLARQSVQRAAELGLELALTNPLKPGELKVSGTISGQLYPEDAEHLAALAAALPEQEVIPLVNLGRLSLQTGDTLVVVAPADYGDLAAMRTLAGLVQQQLDEAHPGCHVLVVPNGATLGVLAKEQA